METKKYRLSYDYNEWYAANVSSGVFLFDGSPVFIESETEHTDEAGELMVRVLQVDGVVGASVPKRFLIPIP